MLQVQGLSVSYGKTQALKDVSFSVEKGQIVSIIGANGAGKTSLLKCISGLVRPAAGTVTYLGKPLEQEPFRIVSRGIVHVPEGRRVFSALTVEDNLRAGAYLTKSKKEVARQIEEQYDRFPRLGERRSQFSATLSGGEQQMLAIARAMMSNPKMILLDEPSLGLAPIIVAEVFKIIQEIRENEITVLLVEQNAKKALSIADHALVLENGKIKKTGTGRELLADPSIAEAYLGMRESACPVPEQANQSVTVNKEIANDEPRND